MDFCDLRDRIENMLVSMGFVADENIIYQLAIQHGNAEAAVDYFIATSEFSKASVPSNSITRDLDNIPVELLDCDENSIALSLWKMGFAVEDSLSAAKNCQNLESGVSYILFGLIDGVPVVKCASCLDKHSMNNMVTLSCNPDPHRFCCECISEYLKIKIDNAEVTTETLCCPHPNCKTSITVDEVKAHVSPQYFEKYERFLLKFLCDSNKWRPCPRCDWFGDITQNDNDVDIWKCVECPNCKHKFCGKCGEIPHKAQADQDITCQQYAQWLQENSAAEKSFEDLIQSSQWKKCPHCACVAELSDGCKFIYCRCGKNFCYVCGITLLQSQHYNHFRNGPGCTGPYGNGCLGPTDVKIDTSQAK